MCCVSRGAPWSCSIRAVTCRCAKCALPASCDRPTLRPVSCRTACSARPKSMIPSSRLCRRWRLLLWPLLLPPRLLLPPVPPPLLRRPPSPPLPLCHLPLPRVPLLCPAHFFPCPLSPLHSPPPALFLRRPRSPNLPLLPPLPRLLPAAALVAAVATTRPAVIRVEAVTRAPGAPAPARARARARAPTTAAKLLNTLVCDIRSSCLHLLSVYHN